MLNDDNEHGYYSTHYVDAQKVFHLKHIQKPSFLWMASALRNSQWDSESSCDSLLIMSLSGIMRKKRIIAIPRIITAVH